MRPLNLRLMGFEFPFMVRLASAVVRGQMLLRAQRRPSWSNFKSFIEMAKKKGVVEEMFSSRCQQLHVAICWVERDFVSPLNPSCCCSRWFRSRPCRFFLMRHDTVRSFTFECFFLFANYTISIFLSLFCRRRFVLLISIARCAESLLQKGKEKKKKRIGRWSTRWVIKWRKDTKRF
jgi:hypothetical protein